MLTGLGLQTSWTKFVPSDAPVIMLAFLAFVKVELKKALDVYDFNTLLIILSSSLVHLATSTLEPHSISGNKSDTVRCCHLSDAYSLNSTVMSSNNLKLWLVSNCCNPNWIGIKSGRYSPSSPVSLQSWMG